MMVPFSQVIKYLRHYILSDKSFHSPFIYSFISSIELKCDQNIKNIIKNVEYKKVTKIKEITKYK